MSEIDAQAAHLLDDRDAYSMLALGVVAELRGGLVIDADKMDAVLSGVRGDLVRAVQQGLIEVPGTQRPDKYRSKGAADPLFGLACTLVGTVEDRGDIDWWDWFPYVEQVAVSSVFGVLLQAVDDGAIGVGSVGAPDETVGE